MKKLMILVLALSMAVGFAGTALAADTVELVTATSGVSRVYWGAVYGKHSSGASAYVLSGTIADDSPVTGATLYSVSNTRENAAGTEMSAMILNNGGWWDSGATPIGGPQLVSGTSTTVIVLVQASAAHGVGDMTSLGTGATLYAINGGTGASYWETGIINPGVQRGIASGGLYTAARTAATQYCIAPVTIDNESVNTTAGATIYGFSGVSSIVAGQNSGVSVWAISAQTGTFSTSGGVQTGLTSFANGGQSAVSAVVVPAVISGESLFVIGYGGVGAGSTLFQFNKNNLLAGVSAEATVGLSADLSDMWIPTPTVSGGSIFVVDNNGGVTSFRTDNRAQNYNVLFTGTEVVSGITASPVSNDKFIVLCSTSSVSAFTLGKNSKLSTGVAEWGYNFGANTTIDTTPAISKGYVWVTVNNNLLANSTIYRFTLNSANGSIATVATFGELTYTSPIIVGGTDSRLWSVSYNPEVSKVKATGAQAFSYWPQFKFDKGKTGNNTKPDDDDPVIYDSDGTCFISTLK
jgi:hypothetical protein